MEKKDFDRLEQYIYIEAILENLDKTVNRVQKLEEEDVKNKKSIKRLRALFFICIIVILLLIAMSLYI